MLTGLFLLQLAVEASSCPYRAVHPAAKCTTVSVPENRTKSRGRQLSLSVLWIPRESRAVTRAPIVFIPGGPGGDIIAQHRAWAQLLGAPHAEHSLVFVDPRGTGASAALSCVLAAEPSRAVSHVRDFLPLERVRTCRQELEKRADLTQYTTEAIAHDLEAVRVALGFERVILFGVSGGTRQAMMYLKRYPRRVEAMILSGMVPPEFRMPMSYAADAQSAFDSLAQSCSRDAQCSRAFPRLPHDFAAVLSTLSRGPVSVPVRLPDATVDSVRITRGIFAERVRTVMYNEETAAQLPYVIARAARDDWSPFVQLAIPALRPPRRDLVAMGHFLSVTCTEDVARIPLDSARAMASRTFLEMYRVEQQKAACAEWPAAQLPADHFEPVHSRVPVLFISGAVDPVTPPRWADTAARHLPNSVHAVMAHAGHGPLFNACARGMIRRFLETLDPRQVDVGCARQWERPAFYVPE